MPDQRLRNMGTATAEGMPQTAPASDLVNNDLVRAWLWWAIAWLTVFPLVGLLVSIKFHYPDFLGETSWLTFGRLRPVHVNGVIFGAFSTPVLGLLYYLVPRLCGRRMAKERWGWWLLRARSCGRRCPRQRIEAQVLQVDRPVLPAIATTKPGKRRLP